MIQYMIKAIYIEMIKAISALFTKKHVDDHHIVALMTFKEDVLPIVYELSRRGYRVTVFAQPKDFEFLKNRQNIRYYPLSSKNIMKVMKEMATAKVIFIDTYYLLMAGFEKKKGQTVIQTWHAAGALKKFGLEDHAINLKHQKVINQYKSVYQATDKYLVGGYHMSTCFERSFGATFNQLLCFGSPRLTTYLKLDLEAHKAKIKKQLGIENKVAVYLPTYREQQRENRILNKTDFELALPEYTLLSKYHPTVSPAEQNTKMCTLDLLIIADLIITDYSSLAIEVSLLDTPALFYVYDEMEYDKVRGLNQFYYQEIPEDYKVYDEQALFQKIREGEIKPLFKEWHQFNTPESLNQVVNYVQKIVRL
ncbi:teichoic acid glycerol-phosphate primase TarB [Staphylococcus canis]|uniref:CDP-glycerol glycerophosphotransferase family protein n=1 Tax=Staphylococcus canis TaxID=2724942 RepID=A0ABS0TB00_9STAP|nr:teichoic acid glycerol-phosphate primase TarB [Staphylococcus canis]MBI5975141.1 CDP-glycerol glycerophosphotransferase family protein [Staphylococcus canis]